MKDRIVKFMEKRGLTPTEFADGIGIQRSNLSHVLSGRNNPGFSFIQKILSAYPEINSRWLITGEGEMLLESPKQLENVEKQPEKIIQPDLFSSVQATEPKQPVLRPQTTERKTFASENEKVENKPRKQLIEPIAEIQPAPKSIENTPSKGNIHKKICKVLIFYDDHTFDDYRPSE